MKICFALLLMVTSSLADGVFRVALPDGEKGDSINCSSAGNMKSCYELAGQYCIYGYSLPNGGVKNAGALAAESLAEGTENRNLWVKCNQDSLVQMYVNQKTSDEETQQLINRSRDESRLRARDNNNLFTMMGFVGAVAVMGAVAVVSLAALFVVAVVSGGGGG